MEAAFRDAEARERSAQAEANATQSVSEAIRTGDVNALNYFIAQRYIDAFRVLAEAPNQKFRAAADGSDGGSLLARRHRGARKGSARRPWR